MCEFGLIVYDPDWQPDCITKVDKVAPAEDCLPGRGRRALSCLSPVVLGCYAHLSREVRAVWVGSLLVCEASLECYPMAAAMARRAGWLKNGWGLKVMTLLVVMEKVRHPV